MAIIYALISVIFVSLLSLLGAVFLVFQRELVHKFITFTLAFSSGVMLGSVFFDLLPESLGMLPEQTFPLTLLGIICFFALEKLLRWHHHVPGDHREEEEAVAYLSLIGDGIHNFVDGVIIGAAYLVSIPIGVTTTLAVIAHEIPHEMSDFTILIHGGFPTAKALWYNLLSALTAVVGALFVLIVTTVFGDLVALLVPFAAGNFLYIASSDLIPELQKKRELPTSVAQILLLIGGVLVMVVVRGLFE